MEFISLPTDILFLPESMQGPTLHLVPCFLCLPSVTIPQSFIISHDLGTFEEHWSDIFKNISNLGLSSVFL